MSTMGAARSLDVSIGGFLSDGRYGESVATRYAAIPLALKIRTHNWAARAATTWMSVDGPANVIDGAARTAGGSRARDNGWSDTWLSLTRYAPPLQSQQVFVDFTLKLKIPPDNDEHTLSTGTTDTELRLDAFKRKGAITWSAGAGYRWRFGVSRYENSANAALGIDVRQTPAFSWGAGLNTAQPSTRTSDATRDMTVYVSTRRVAGSKWTFFGVRGLSDASADVGIGVTFNYAYSGW